MTISRPAQLRDKVRAHRSRLRRRGLRPVQFWLPDVRSPGFLAEARRQAALIGAGTSVPPQIFRRGEIWTVAVRPDPAAPPGRAVILQDDAFAETPAITLCPFSDRRSDAPLLRVTVEPSALNGLPARGHLMIDRIGSVAKRRLLTRVGRLSDEDLMSVARALLVFLGFGGRRSS